MNEEGRVGIEGPRARDARRYSHEAMHTVFEVYALHPDERYAAQAAQAAFDLTDRLERELSRFIANSDITRINHLARARRPASARTTLECLVIARHMFDLTGGAFDVSIGTGLSSLELDDEDCAVRATKNGVRLDLGGIGKGYAVDLMAEVLEEWGLRAALVHGGFSSVLALEGPASGDGWPLTLSDPGGAFARARAPGGTSDGARGLRPVQGRSHRRAAERRARARAARRLGRGAAAGAVTRRTPTAQGRIAVTAVTDALTTAFMLLGTEEIAALCERSPGLEAWVLPQQDGSGSSEAELLHFGGLHGSLTRRGPERCSSERRMIRAIGSAAAPCLRPANQEERHHGGART